MATWDPIANTTRTSYSVLSLYWRWVSRPGKENQQTVLSGSGGPGFHRDMQIHADMLENAMLGRSRTGSCSRILDWKDETAPWSVEVLVVACGVGSLLPFRLETVNPGLGPRTTRTSKWYSYEGLVRVVLCGVGRNDNRHQGGAKAQPSLASPGRVPNWRDWRCTLS